MCDKMNSGKTNLYRQETQADESWSLKKLSSNSYIEPQKKKSKHFTIKKKEKKIHERKRKKKEDEKSRRTVLTTNQWKKQAQKTLWSVLGDTSCFQAFSLSSFYLLGYQQLLENKGLVV